ncbi:MAG: hypothetical protein NZ585_12435 [Chloracidobacterium sp.]|nr:hypothetical protein [Chloracidobacterium sp.]MDW8216233.1 hypothetical protein [Acidobacteriota bacterium]
MPPTDNTANKRTARKAVEAEVKANQEVALKALAGSQPATAARKAVRAATDEKHATKKCKTGASDASSAVPTETKDAKPATSNATSKLGAVEAPSTEALDAARGAAKKSKSKLAATPAAPATTISPALRRNREREALNLYTTAMESFKQTDYDRARDILQLLLSDFELESEIAARARTFLKICEQKLHSPAL